MEAAQNLILVSKSDSLLVYAMAYVSKYGAGDDFKILVVDDQGINIESTTNENVNQELITTLSKLRMQFVTFDEAHKSNFDTVFLLPAFRLFASTNSYLMNFSFNSIGYFADGLRNDLHFSPSAPIKNLSEKHIFLGFKGDYNPFCKDLCNQVEIQIVELEEIAKIWESLVLNQVRKSWPKFQKDDLFIAVRYWGDEPYVYRSGITTNKLIMQIISKIPDLKRVIVKPIPKSYKKSDLEITSLERDCNLLGIDVVIWGDLFENSMGDDISHNPEGLFMGGHLNGLGHFFGFDSTLNVIAKLYSPKTILHLPNFVSELKLFENPISQEIVEQHCCLIAD